MLILVALFLFGANGISDQEKMIMTVIIIVLLASTFLLSVATVLSEVWRLVQSSLNPNIQITSLTSTLSDDCGDHTSNIQKTFEKFLSGLTSSLARELIAYELSLLQKFHFSGDLDDEFDFNQMQELLSDCSPEIISKQFKFLFSLSYPLQFSLIASIRICSTNLQFRTLKESLSCCPEWYIHYLWNRLVLMQAFLRRHKRSLDSIDRGGANPIGFSSITSREENPQEIS